MNKILVIIICIISLNTYGQNYVTFPDSNAIWVNTFYYISWPYGTSHPVFTLVDVRNYCLYGSDTVINSIEYKQIHFCDSTYVGALRDINGKVFYIPKDSLQEFLLYDFSVSAGDTLHDVYVSGAYSTGLYTFIITEVNSVTINGINRKRVFIEVGSYWIEGIGCVQGLFRDPILPCATTDSRLECMSYNDTTIFPGFHIEPCYLGLGLKEPIKNIDKFSVYPNPSEGKIFINCESSDIYILNVYNILGQKINCKIKSNNLKTSELLFPDNTPNGTYLIKITTFDEFGISRKIVINRSN